MLPVRSLTISAAALALAGCTPAQLVFGGPPVAGQSHDALVFYDPSPHLLVSVAGDCTVTSQVIAIPGRARTVRLKSGHGASELSLGFANGLITSVGQKSDTKVPETIAAIGGLAGSIGEIAKGQSVKATGLPPAASPPAKTCPPQAYLYPIDDGKVTLRDKLEGLPLKKNP